MSLRNHRISPKGGVRKDRDYLLFEKNAFLSGMREVLRGWQQAGLLTWPGSAYVVTPLIEGLEKGDTKKLREAEDAARKAAWEYQKTPYIHAIAGFLLFLDAINNHLLAETKTPDSFEADRRKRAKECMTQPIPLMEVLAEVEDQKARLAEQEP